jgi:hypothetical protein
VKLREPFGCTGCIGAHVRQGIVEPRRDCRCLLRRRFGEHHAIALLIGKQRDEVRL